MGRPRKDKTITNESVASLTLKIEEQKIKMQKLMDKRDKLENAEYIVLGKKVKELFGLMMPNDLNGQIAFLTRLSQQLVQSQIPSQTPSQTPSDLANGQAINSNASIITYNRLHG